MNVKIQHLGGVKFEATARGHRVLCDQSAGNGGTDSGMTPPEFLMAALGTCAGYYAAEYLKLHSIQCEGLEISISAEKAKAPARLGSFTIDVFAPGVGPEHEAGLRRAAEACLIHNTLTHIPMMATNIHTAALTGV